MTPRRTSASPVLIPTRSFSGAPPTDVEVLGVLGDPQARTHGALGIVLVRGGDPEDPDDGVPDELLHDAAVGLDLGPGHREVRRRASCRRPRDRRTPRWR